MKPFTFTEDLWANGGPSGWYFITLPQDLSMDIKKLFGGYSPGFGSVGVKVKVGNTEWETSIFYDTKVEAYLLPVKKAIRQKESMEVGQKLMVELWISQIVDDNNSQ